MQKTWKPTAAGVLAIIGGALNILLALGFSLFVFVPAPFRYSVMSVGFMAAIFLGTCIVALIGGIFALQRRHWGFSLAGAICAMMPPSTLLGILSTVFVALAHEEFVPGKDSRTIPLAELDTSTRSPSSTEGTCEPQSNEPSEAERNA